MRQRGAVRIGCGARFAGDRRNAALRLLLQVPDMHYLVLECLAEGLAMRPWLESNAKDSSAEERILMDARHL